MIKAMEWIVRGFGLLVINFTYLCMNCFTIPIFIVALLICKIIRVRKPHFARYSLMFYPSWSDKSHSTLMKDLREIWKKEDAKVKKHRPIRAWEERFFD